MTDDPVAQQRECIDAVRRLKRGMVEYPDARQGLERCAELHIRRAGELAVRIAREARSWRASP
jgi:hypothetical protein